MTRTWHLCFTKQLLCLHWTNPPDSLASGHCACCLRVGQLWWFRHVRRWGWQLKKTSEEALNITCQSVACFLFSSSCLLLWVFFWLGWEGAPGRGLVVFCLVIFHRRRRLSNLKNTPLLSSHFIALPLKKIHSVTHTHSKTFLNWSNSEVPLKRALLLKSSAKMQPQLHMSTEVPYSACIKTSGERYHNVTTWTERAEQLKDLVHLDTISKHGSHASIALVKKEYSLQ